ncbi:hypothetical protein [Amycolatopsis sp. NPDC059021]|uniref:hypothetical protein n=1 Tax=Amycolatopsis sp. NPDC059021 TaxID=3346704 RepID=UPI00366F8A7C
MSRADGGVPCAAGAGQAFPRCHAGKGLVPRDGDVIEAAQAIIGASSKSHLP